MNYKIAFDISKVTAKNPTTYVYTDGSCPNNQNCATVAGAGVWFADKDNRNVSEKIIDNGNQVTNNIGELTAILRALEITKDDPNILCIYTDSMYCIRSFTEWMWDWQNKGWKNSKKKVIENYDLIIKVIEAINARKYPICFKYVAGHSGDKGNDAANDLACKACLL